MNKTFRHNQNSGKYPRLARRLLSGTTTVLFLLTVGPAGLLQAQTAARPLPVTGTVGFETGLHELAFVTLNKGVGATVNWGDGSSSRGLLRCFEPVLRPNQCHVFGTHRYLETGAYTVTISYKSPGRSGSDQIETTTATIFPVGDFVILSIGDSVASGEGSPAVRFGGFRGSQPNRGFWDDLGSNYEFPDPSNPEEAELVRPCHRTAFAGPVLAARRVASNNPVTFIHFACSGATINDLPGNVSVLEQQLRLARERLERVDVLLISGGANNMMFRTKGPLGNFNDKMGVGFGSVVERCLRPASPCSEDGDFRTDIRDSIDGAAGRIEVDKDGKEYHFRGLPALYQDLDDVIHCRTSPDADNCSDDQIPKLVLITEYFDPTHDENGEFKGPVCPDAGIKKVEWQYLHEGIMERLNHHVRNSPWHAVEGIARDFLTHGYCSTDRWVVRAPESFARQGDFGGTAHPNETGQAAYGDRIYDSLVNLNPPITQASASAGGRPYSFGTWTANDVKVTLAARNPISESGVGATYFSVNNPACAPSGVNNCSSYTGPFSISTSGVHTVRFFSENRSGAFESVAIAVVRIDKDPPGMSCTATPSVLFPPNGKMVSVETTVEAIDGVSGAVPFVLAAAGASEPHSETDIQGFMVGQADTAGLMRARRSGSSGEGRDYTLIYEAVDELGNTGRCTVVVKVPHDRRAPRN